MSGKLFYRERTKIQDGAKLPRFRVVAAAGLDLKVYGNHFRLQELEQLAAACDAELIRLEAASEGKYKDHSGPERE